MDKIVPLISSGTAGLLGVLHLPRLWLKVSLAAKGLLADGYPDCGKGFDQMTLNDLGLNVDATLKYIRDNHPTYPQFETWVRQQPDAKLDRASIDRHNAAIRGYIHDDDTRRSILAASGIPDDGSIRDAVTLNQLDDWQEIHAAITG
ncbi:MAG: DUF5069 domain-containing protein [Candidatus Latescibacterota bacterium]